MAGIDEEIGRRIRALRWSRGLSLEQVGERIGVGYQQIQKYEAGANRLSASRLFQLAQVFDVPVGSFFETVRRAADEPGEDLALLDVRGFRLAYEFDKLSEAQKRAVLSLVRSMTVEQVAPEQRDGT